MLELWDFDYFMQFQYSYTLWTQFLMLLV